jgi:hypothetical protein
MFSTIANHAGKFVIASLVLLICGIPNTARAARTLGNCAVPQITFSISDSDNSTASASFQTVAGSSISFVQGGAKAGCVIIDFQASAFANTNGNEIITLNTTLDGQEGVCLPDQPSFMAGSVFWAVTNTISFFCLHVAPGSHTITVEFRSANGGVVDLINPVTVVRHQ